MLHFGTDPFNFCVFGFDGADQALNGNGNQPVQTYAWSSWVRPGIFARPNGGTDWALQDISGLSHEIAEWADDPFINNYVEPWLTPTAPQYGCTNLLQTGDPVVAIGFAMGTNVYDQGPNPDGTQSADGYSIRRTKSSSRGSCAWRRTTCQSQRKARQRISADTP
jgi:hypothetical protein